MSQPEKANWEQALDTFLADWRILPEYEGALVCGSHVHGTATPNSDIDVHIILAEEVSWRERGNRVVGGHLIEYFANPVRQFPQQLDMDVARGKRTVARMLAAGRVWEDRGGEVLKLQEWAKSQMTRDLPKVEGTALAAAKYSLWDNYNELEGTPSSLPIFSFLYPQVVAGALNLYAGVHGLEAPPPSKALRFFTEPGFADRYRMTPFPDAEFGRLFAACLQADGENRLSALRQLVEFVLESGGGFQIDGWKLRTEAAPR